MAPMHPNESAAPTNPHGTNIFSAGASAAGYAMQFRYSLYCAIERLKTSLDWQLSIEAGDDIEISAVEGYRSLLQLKHRAPGTRLTDSSSDMWKTLRIWCEGVRAKTIEIGATQFHLVTTSAPVEDGISTYLGLDESKRSISAAAAELTRIATSSRNETNKKSYAAWLALPQDLQEALLNRIVIVTDSPRIGDVESQLEQACSLSARRAQVKTFVGHLEGWWFQRCIRLLTEPLGYISGDELDSKISDLRESFLPENLPVDSDVPHLEPELEAFSDYIFVKQAQLVEIGMSRIASAVRDYLRAYTQRSRWTRDSLIGPRELDDYERRLVEEWRYVFDRLTDDLPAEAADTAKVAAARQVYQWVEEATAPPIRTQCTERFLVRGSLHMLADRLDSGVGWHPDFTARLINLLEPADQ
jgi:hypothetical protein